MEAKAKAALKKVRNALEPYPLLQQAEDAVGVPKEYIASAIVPVVITVLYILGGGMSLICAIDLSSTSNLAGFIYPSIMSFKAIESTNKQDDTQWLTYWVVYASFSVLEVMGGILLSWFPFWYSFKLAFLMYAMLPQTEGAAFLYNNFLKDFFHAAESKATGSQETKKET